MKDKKLVILYILMLVVGVVLLLTKSTPEVKQTRPETEIKIEVVDKPKSTLEKITVVTAKNDIEKRHIFTVDDYLFSTIEVDTKLVDKSRYITSTDQIDAYVAKNNIQANTLLEHSFVVSPLSNDYVLFALKPDNFMYPFKLSQSDSYLFKNLHSGDLVDLYVFYGEESIAAKNNQEGKYVSPSRDFITNRLKPIIVGKRVLFFEKNTDKETEQNIGKIQLELSNHEIKLISTLMSNAKIVMYPSTFKSDIDNGLELLSGEEKIWPLSDKSIFSGKQINKLRGN